MVFGTDGWKAAYGPDGGTNETPVPYALAATFARRITAMREASETATAGRQTKGYVLFCYLYEI